MSLPVSSSYAALKGPRIAHRTLRQVFESRNEAAKDSIAEILANSKHIWDCADFNQQLDELRRSDLTVSDWLLTI